MISSPQTAGSPVDDEDSEDEAASVVLVLPSSVPLDDPDDPDEEVVPSPEDVVDPSSLDDESGSTIVVVPVCTPVLELDAGSVVLVDVSSVSVSPDAGSFEGHAVAPKRRNSSGAGERDDTERRYAETAWHCHPSAG